MIPLKLITKENAKTHLEDRGQDFMAIFVSGADLKFINIIGGYTLWNLKKKVQMKCFI